MSNKNEFQQSIIMNENLLHPLGWNDFFSRALGEMERAEGRVVRVISVQRGSLLVSDGENEWLCKVSGKLLHSEGGMHPIAGDWVLSSDAVISDILPRKSMLSRGAAGSRGGQAGGASREQAIAANIDVVFIVCGLDRDFNVRRVERYLSLVYNCGLMPVVVLTKSDLHEAPESFAAEMGSVAFGVPVVLSSCLDCRGKIELESWLGEGRTIAMLGSSGAGKSTLANMLYGSDIQTTGAVSSAVGKGRHHTTAREMIRMPQGGMLMDNPGIREIAFSEDGQGVDVAFPEIKALAQACRFSDCSHASEPDCAVAAAVESGDLSADRLESYRKMKREMAYLAARQDKSADRVEKERWKHIALSIRTVNKRKKNR